MFISPIGLVTSSHGGVNIIRVPKQPKNTQKRTFLKPSRFVIHQGDEWGVHRLAAVEEGQFNDKGAPCNFGARLTAQFNRGGERPSRRQQVIEYHDSLALGQCISLNFNGVRAVFQIIGQRIRWTG